MLRVSTNPMAELKCCCSICGKTGPMPIVVSIENLHAFLSQIVSRSLQWSVAGWIGERSNKLCTVCSEQLVASVM